MKGKYNFIPHPISATRTVTDLLMKGKYNTRTKQTQSTPTVTDLIMKDRHWVCPECGAELDRDTNAGINLKIEAIRLINN